MLSNPYTLKTVPYQSLKLQALTLASKYYLPTHPLTYAWPPQPINYH